jgi:hypothetical protein
MSQTNETPLDETTLQIGPLRIENFAALIGDLRTAVDQFQGEQTPENFAVIISQLRQFGLSGADVWQQAASYARRNPLRVAMMAGLAFYAFKGLASTTATTRRFVH